MDIKGGYDKTLLGTASASPKITAYRIPSSRIGCAGTEPPATEADGNTRTPVVNVSGGEQLHARTGKAKRSIRSQGQALIVKISPRACLDTNHHCVRHLEFFVGSLLNLYKVHECTVAVRLVNSCTASTNVHMGEGRRRKKYTIERRGCSTESSRGWGERTTKIKASAKKCKAGSLSSLVGHEKYHGDV